MSALEYQIGPVDGNTRDHGEIDVRNVHVGLSRLPGDRWIHHSVSSNQCILTDNNNTEVVLVLSTTAPRLGTRPPSVFIDSCIVDDGSDDHSSRTIVFICIAHTDNDGNNRGKVQKLELEFDNRCESPLAPLIEYNAGISCPSQPLISSVLNSLPGNSLSHRIHSVVVVVVVVVASGMSIDIHDAIDNFSFSSSSASMQHIHTIERNDYSSLSHPSSKGHGSGSLGPMMVRYSSSRLTSIAGLDEASRGGIGGASPGAFAVCVHWCSHRAVAFGLSNGGNTSYTPY